MPGEQSIMKYPAKKRAVKRTQVGGPFLLLLHVNGIGGRKAVKFLNPGCFNASSDSTNMEDDISAKNVVVREQDVWLAIEADQELTCTPPSMLHWQ